MRRLRLLTRVVPLVLVASPVLAEASGHHDPIAPIVLALAVILLAGKLGAEVAVRLGHAAVLGELLAGVLLGNLRHLGFDGFDGFPENPGLDALARLGVIVLLFQVGLESTVRDMLRVGLPSLIVAAIGVVLPFAGGYYVTRALAPDIGFYAHVFAGATLTATSVGITARVFKDLGTATSEESRIVLGAAVIDDVLGLVVLAVVVGLVEAASAGTTLSSAAIAWTVTKATLFLVGALALGVYLAPRALAFASRLKASGVLLTMSLAFTFLVSWAASAMGLAAIVGAFAAGLVLEDIHYESYKQRGEPGLEHLVEPIGSFLVPVFFVLMGMKTDLASFADASALTLALALTVVGVVGKIAAGVGAHGRPADKLTIGLGMIPRGEVGLIFAGIGAELRVGDQPVLDARSFTALVIVIVVSTLVTPPLLAARIRRLAPASG